MGWEHSFTLHTRPMARGLGIFEQYVRWTIFPSAFRLQPKRVYCLPVERHKMMQQGSPALISQRELSLITSLIARQPGEGLEIYLSGARGGCADLR